MQSDWSTFWFNVVSTGIDLTTGGVYFSFSKICSIVWLGKIYDDLLRKKRKYKGEEVENGEKKEILHVFSTNILEKRVFGKI